MPPMEKYSDEQSEDRKHKKDKKHRKKDKKDRKEKKHKKDKKRKRDRHDDEFAELEKEVDAELQNDNFVVDGQQLDQTLKQEDGDLPPQFDDGDIPEDTVLD